MFNMPDIQQLANHDIFIKASLCLTAKSLNNCAKAFLDSITELN